ARRRACRAARRRAAPRGVRRSGSAACRGELRLGPRRATAHEDLRARCRRRASSNGGRLMKLAVPQAVWARLLLLLPFAAGVGAFANAVLPGRVGELARVAVLTRKLPGRRGLWATLVGTVFAHRVFDLVPVVGLIAYVLFTAKIPHWAIASLEVVVGIGVAGF